MYFCNTCLSNFTRKSSFDKHNYSLKHIQRLQDRAKYKCECGKFYMSSSSLSTHRSACISVHPPTSINKNNSIKVADFEEEKETIKKEITETLLTDLQNKFEEFCEKSLPPPSSIQIAQNPPPPPLKTKRQGIPSKIRLQIKESQNHQCGSCQKELNDIFEIDHITALQFGGTNLIDNLMALCCECHSKKSIKENKCRKKIQAAILSILEES